MLQNLIDEIRKDGPSKSTRFQEWHRNAVKTKQKISGNSHQGTSSRLQKPIEHQSSRHYISTATEGLACIEFNAKCDDGIDNTLISSNAAQEAVSMGNRKINKFQPISFHVGLKKYNSAELFILSRTWTVPRITLNLSSRPLALLNLTFLVADDGLASEDILIGQSILRNLKVDPTHVLEQKREVLNGVDCSHVGSTTISGGGSYVSRIMIARENHINNSDSKGLEYYEIRTYTDPFHDPSLLDPIDCNRTEELSDRNQ